MSPSAQSNSEGRSSRRSLLAIAGLTGLGLAATGLPTSTAFAADPTGGPTDGAAQFAAIPGRNINEKVLNFALTLEILEADLYRQALNFASGKSLSAPLQSTAGGYRRAIGTGGLTSGTANDLYLYLVQFAYVEAAHRDFLTNAIKAGGGTPVSRNPKGYKFPQGPASNIKDVLTKILPLEETGVRAYLGALPYFTDLNLAVIAGGIYSTECRHSAVISSDLGLSSGPTKMPGDQAVTPTSPGPRALEFFLKPTAVLSAAKAFFA